MTTVKKIKSQLVHDASSDEKDELQAGHYVHKFNEICRQNKLNKPSYKWKYDKTAGQTGSKRKVKYYISQDQLDISVKVIEKNKTSAKLACVKLAYEEALKILSSKQVQKTSTDQSGSPDERYHEQLKNIGTFTKIDKKELLPELARVEQDIDVFLESECKIYLPEKPSTQASLAKNESIESNPIEYSMVRRGQKYFDINTPATRAPSPLPNVPLPTPKKQLDKQKSEEEPKKDEPVKEVGSTLRITSGLLNPVSKKGKKEAEDYINVNELNVYQTLNNLQTIRTEPKMSMQINANYDIEMLNYLRSQKKLLQEANEQIKTDPSNPNFLRLLNLLLLRNKKVSYEIKISSDFGKLSKLIAEIGPPKISLQPKETTAKQPEKLSEKFEDKATKKKSSEDAFTSLTSLSSTEVLSAAQKENREGSPLPLQTTDNKCSIVWLCRLNCFYLDCCFATVIGYGSTVQKSTNNSALKMLQLLYSLIN